MSPIQQLFQQIYDFFFNLLAKIGAGLVGQVPGDNAQYV